MAVEEQKAEEKKAAKKENTPPKGKQQKKQETPKKPEGPVYNLKGERYPIKAIVWQFLRTNKFLTGSEVTPVIESNDLILNI